MVGAPRLSDDSDAAASKDDGRASDRRRSADLTAPQLLLVGRGAMMSPSDNTRLLARLGLTRVCIWWLEPLRAGTVSLLLSFAADRGGEADAGSLKDISLIGGDGDGEVLRRLC